MSNPSTALIDALPTVWRAIFFVAGLVLVGLQFLLWPSAWIAVALSLPFLSLLAFAWRRSLRAHGAAGLYSLVFLIHGLTESVASVSSRRWAIAETLACLLLFLALLGIARAVRRWKLKSSQEPGPG